MADFTHSYFAVYDRQTGAYVKSFRVVNGPSADGCEKTDSITAYAGNLGLSFPFGMFVCQDNNNNNVAPGVGYQDLKLVRLEKVVDLEPGPGDALPVASFTADCIELACTFDAVRDDGAPVRRTVAEVPGMAADGAVRVPRARSLRHLRPAHGHADGARQRVRVCVDHRIR